MFDKRRYIRNIAFNQAGFVGSVAVGFLLSPFIVHRLGDSGYGYWSLVVMVTGYFAYCDLGIFSGVTHYVTRHLADGDRAQLDAKLNSALTALTGVGIAVLCASVALAFFFTRYFHVAPEAAAPVRAALLLMGAMTAVKFPLSVFQAMLVGAQRFDILSSIALGGKLAHAGLVYLAFTLHQGLPMLALCSASMQILQALAIAAAARRVVPSVRVRPLVFRSDAFGELIHYGAFNFLINLFTQFGAGFWAYIIARKVGAAAVTYYSIGSEVLPYMGEIASAVSTPLLQIVIPMDIRQDLDSLRAMLLTGTRYFFGLICLIGVNLLLVGHAFLGAWMGEKYLLPEPYGSSATVLSILTLANMAALSSSVAQQILLGRRKNKFFAMVVLAESAGIVLLALAWVPRWGIIGMALATTLPIAVCEGLLIPALAARHAGADLKAYWLRGIVPNVAVAAGVYGVGKLALARIHAGGWTPVFLAFSVVSLLHLAAAFLFIVEQDHRRMLLPWLARKLAWGPGETR